jgi:uncharacterized tellurite resistance protein B-like protein
MVKLFASSEKVAEAGISLAHLAPAALMVEAARLDGLYERRERERILALLCARFTLDRQAGEAVLAEAERQCEAASHLVGFTRRVKEDFSHAERIELMEMIWEVAYADGSLHELESNLMRRLAGLLHISDRDSGAARKRALARQAGGSHGAPAQPPND